jgi:hypothetical protein
MTMMDVFSFVAGVLLGVGAVKLIIQHLAKY